MRILHLTVEYPPVVHGGLGTAVGGLVTASVAADLDVRVLLVNDGSAAHDAAGYGRPSASEPQSIDIANVITTTWAAAHKQSLRLIENWRPDVLHLHVFWLWQLAKQLRDDTGIPIVYTVHSLDRAEYDIGYGPPECLTQWDTQAATIREADLVLALTHHEARLIERYCPDSLERTRVVGNGIAACTTSTAPTSRVDRPVQVLFSGRFVDRKGIRDLLAAIPLVLARTTNVEFTLAGGQRGATSAEMDTWWRPLDLPYPDRVRFTGWLNEAEMHACYHRADILVVPSWYEPFGMVVLEGMQHGLAIAASSVGGPAAILANRRTGLLFSPHKPAGLAAAVLRLIQEPSLRNRVASRARHQLARTWTWDHILPRVLDVYTEVHRSYAAAA